MENGQWPHVISDSGICHATVGGERLGTKIGNFELQHMYSETCDTMQYWQ